MKKLTFILSLFSLNLQAQCIQVPNCTNSVSMCNTITNMSLQGNWCFEGHGSISNSVNWNNWDWIRFNSISASININQNVNFGGGAKKVYNTGYAVNYWGNTSFNGSDTIFVGDGCTVQVTNPISNNSNSGNYNTIVLGVGSRLFIGPSMVEYHVGDTIRTNPSNNSNNIYVVGCSSTPLSIDEVKFYLNGNLLYWQTESTDIQIQYSETGNSFRTIHYSSYPIGNLSIKEAGFYRLFHDGKYSKILQYNMSKLSEKRIYYYMGNFYHQQPQTEYYGTKKI